MARKVDLARSVDAGRWQWEGSVGKSFEKVRPGTRSVTQVMGSFQIAWAVATERDIVHFRVQTIRSGYAARVAEAAVILDQRGPSFVLTLNIPTTPEFPSNEIQVFAGRGWIMDPDLLDEFKLDVVQGNDEVYFWAGKDPDVYDDSGLLNYHEKEPSIVDRPTAFVRENREGETVAALVPSNRRRRRIRPRR